MCIGRNFNIYEKFSPPSGQRNNPCRKMRVFLEVGSQETSCKRKVRGSGPQRMGPSIGVEKRGYVLRRKVQTSF
jgi:hypothetical protein